MKPDQNCYNFIKQRENFKSVAYKDSAGIFTIGYGSILYHDGTHVKEGDTITEDAAEALLEFQVNTKAFTVNSATASAALNQNEFNALVSFTYNAGVGAFLGSTLLKRVNANPDDQTIRDAFMMWDKAHVDGQLVVVDGLSNRRSAESDLYFTPITA